MHLLQLLLGHTKWLRPAAIPLRAETGQTFLPLLETDAGSLRCLGADVEVSQAR